MNEVKALEKVLNLKKLRKTFLGDSKMAATGRKQKACLLK
jgi:hypothetical protein